MKNDKILSVIFLILMIFSSSGYSSPDDYNVTPSRLAAESGAQVNEDSEIDLHEFRRTSNIRVYGGGKPRCVTSKHPIFQLLFRALNLVRGHALLTKILSANSSVKLFIDLGALLV